MTPATTIVDFIFDFASPNAYLAHAVIPGIAQRTGATFRIVPALLGGIFKLTGNQAPMTAFAGVKGKLAYEALEMDRFIARHGLTRYRLNPHFPVNTLLLMRGLVAAQHDGFGDAYIAAILPAMWEDGRKMDDPAVVAAVLDAAGLDSRAILARTQDGAVKQALMDSTQAAVDRGAFGIPTFFVGDAMFFGKDRLRDVEDFLLGR